MKSTEVISQLKTLLGMEVQLEQMELSNGTVLEAESFEKGQEVFIKTEDEKVALPEGIYDLADSRKLIVIEEGLIDEIKAESETEENEEMQEEQAILEEEKKEEKNEMTYATKEELAEVKEMVEEIKAMIEKETKDEMSEEVQEPVVSEEEELKEELSKPAATAIKHSPEVETEKAQKLYAQSRQNTTLDRVMSKIANIKN